MAVGVLAVSLGSIAGSVLAPGVCVRLYPAVVACSLVLELIWFDSNDASCTRLGENDTNCTSFD